VTSVSVLGPQETGTHEFDAILRLPVEPAVALVLRDASWSHRGRWHLSGVLHALPEDIGLLSGCDTAEIVYADKSSEILDWYTVRGNLAYQMTEVHGRFGSYVRNRPRYPRGRGDVRLAGVEVTAAVVPRLYEIVDKHLPGLTDQQRRGWLVAALQGFRDEEVGAATRRLARQGADALDQLADLRRTLSDVVDDWLIDAETDRALDTVRKIEAILDRSEKGLPL
jgi:hypothetical protein